MLNFNYKYTDREFLHYMKLNDIAFAGPWKVYGFTLLCLLPSVVIAITLQARLTFMVIGGMALVAAIAAFLSFFKKRSLPDAYDINMKFEEHFLKIDFSHSKSELKWGALDDIREDRNDFVFQRKSFGSIIPKRVIGEKVEDCCRFFEVAKTRTKEGSPDCPMFAQLVLSKSEYLAYTFRYEEEDIDRILKSKFTPVTEATSEESAPAKSSGCFALGFLIFAIAVVASVFFPATIGSSGGDLHPIMLLTWILPFLLVGVWTRIVRGIRATKLRKFEKQDGWFRIHKDGWITGNQDGIAFFDWKDVEGIFEAAHFIGFKTINQLLYVIPKRIFNGDAEYDRAVGEILDLKREACRPDEPFVATVVETGNPFQPPQQ